MAQNHSPIKLRKVSAPPGAESGFAVDIDTLKDASKKLMAEYNSLAKATGAGQGSLIEHVRIATNSIAPEYGGGALGDYPAARGLGETVDTAFNVIPRSIREFGIDELANMVDACVNLYITAERDIKDKVAAARKADARVSVMSGRGTQGSVQVSVPGSTSFNVPADAFVPISGYSIRQSDDIGSWSGNYGDLDAIVRSMRPQALWDAAVAYQKIAQRVNESTAICSGIARGLSRAWGGRAAQAAMNSMRQLYDRQSEVVAAAMQIADAAGWHGDKQSIWKTSITLMDVARQEGFDTSRTVAQGLMRQIQEQTIQTNNAFPATLYQIDLKSVFG